ncbi:MAG: three-Cys-motif partner protein TcmP [Bacteroidales bacterium]|nr:three-Cys-motif partner protein TcmP [Bacteroidales bacterium]
MVKTKQFFDRQTALTLAKTKIYKEYIEGYLPKLLMTYGTCLIADLFCGAGKNGSKDGSPLILIDRIKYILTSKQLKERKNIKVHILFNDQDEKNIKNLENELSKISFDRSIINIILKNQKYEDILSDLIRKPEKQKIPKFFFLDPFSYANVKMNDLQNLMQLSFTEILLFSPLFHTYRFTTTEAFDEQHKTRRFIEEFTTKGMVDYGNAQNYMHSIREKLLNVITVNKKNSTPYVRSVLLDGGFSKNGLFLITSHQKGMLLMNKILIKNTDDGSTVNVKDLNQSRIFSSYEASTYFDDFKSRFLSYLKEKSELTNEEICDFTIREGFAPKQVKKIIKEQYDKKKLQVFSTSDEEITNSSKWRIADDIKEITKFKIV